MRFMRLTADERALAERLLAEYRARPKNADASFRSLCGAAARAARHGPPPTRNQRLGYRTAKRNRARALARQLYGDPTADVPRPTGR
jgi:hypothetical protein